MALSIFKRSKSFAGMAIQPEGLHYVEISGALGDLSCRFAFVEVSPPAIRQDALADMTGLLPAMATLSEEIGGFRVPVSLGVPSLDCLTRTIEFPPMELEEARAAMGFEFERHFPFPASEAIYDLALVELPGTEGRSAFLVAASGRKSVETFINLASEAGLPLQALEPANLAAFRAVSGPTGSKGGFMVLIFGEETTQLVVAYKDNGVLFRTLLFSLRSFHLSELASALSREITSTLVYVRKIFKELSVDVLVVCGAEKDVATAVQEEVSLPVVLLTDTWEVWGIKPPKGLNRDGWETAIGLAVRDLL